jgi:hypothetical protein
MVCQEHSAIEQAGLVAPVKPAADALAIAGIGGILRRGCATPPKEGTLIGVPAESEAPAFATGKPIFRPAPPERWHAWRAVAP